MKCPLDLVKVLDILAGDGSVYLGDDVTVTHSHLIEISVLPLFSFLFGFIEILLAVLDLWETLLVVGPSSSAAALNEQTDYENGRPYCRDYPGHPALWNCVQDLDILVNNSVNFYSLPDPVEDERLLNKVVSSRHQNSSPVEGGSQYCETFLKVESE